MSTKRVCIGAATVVMLVVLRLSLGCHFLYEGVWKIENRKKFTAEPFLSEAKGPLAPVFYAMLDDVDGTNRLTPGSDEKGKPVVKAESTLAAWKSLMDQYSAALASWKQREEKRIDKTADDEAQNEAERGDVQKRYDEQLKAGESLYNTYEGSLNDYLRENAEKILGYFDSLKRFKEEQAQGGNGAPYYKKRVWDWEHEPEGPLGRQGYQKQAKGWLTYIDKMGDEFQAGLRNLLDEDQRPGYFKASWNPLQWSRIEQINFAVTYGLTAIGLCLMLGLFTRLAALGGAAFMFFVLLTQPSLPWIYPPPGPESGHALLIDKNFIELTALLLLATTAAGRWGGLDALLWQWLPFPLGARKKEVPQVQATQRT